MDYIESIMKWILLIGIFVIITRIFMTIAAYIGEKLGIGRLFIKLCKKIRDLVH